MLPNLLRSILLWNSTSKESHTPLGSRSVGTQQVLNKCTPKVNPQRPPCLTSSLCCPCVHSAPAMPGWGLVPWTYQAWPAPGPLHCSPSVEYSFQACSLAHSRHSVNSGLNGWTKLCNSGILFKVSVSVTPKHKLKIAAARCAVSVLTQTENPQIRHQQIKPKS